MLAYLPDEGLNYTISADQATAVRLAMSVAVPSVADKIGADDIANKTVVEATDAVRHALERSASKMVSRSIWLMVVTAVVFLVLFYFLLHSATQGRGSSSARGGTRSARARASATTHRAPRRSHR